MNRPLLVLFSLCLALTGFAQPDAPERTFRIFSVGGTFDDLRFDPAPGRNALKLLVAPSPSESHPAPASGKLVLYRELPMPADAPPGAKPKQEEAVRVDIPSGWNRSLIIIAAAPERRFTAKVINDDFEKHPAGVLRALNFSSFQAGLRLNQDTHLIDMGDEALLPFSSGAVLVQVAVGKEGKWELILSRERATAPRRHSYLFIFDNTPPPPGAGGEAAAQTSSRPAFVNYFTEPVPVPDESTR
ncbi:MAG: hypothetical protein ABII82_05845 [Verrucomicrobiota bacterium]